VKMKSLLTLIDGEVVFEAQELRAADSTMAC